MSTELDDIEELVSKYRTRLLRFVLLSLNDADVASSIVQDTFLKAYKSRASFRGDCSVSTWLTGIALNLVRDQRRSRKYQFWRTVDRTAIDVIAMAATLPSRESSVEKQLISKERALAVAKAANALSPRQRSVFLMRFVEEMEPTEIAQASGMPINTVKTHLLRALKVLREQVREGNA